MVNTIKQYCIDSDLFKLYSQVIKSLRIHDYNVKNGTDLKCPFSYLDAVELNDMYFNDNDIRHELNNLSNSYYARVQRLKKRIALMLSYDGALFLTITFTDKVLNKTSPDTRRQYVRRWLDKNCALYVANIDFGSKNHREHYHAVVLPYDLIDYMSFKKGSVNGKHANSSDDDLKRMSKYVAKLTNHAIKETTKNHKIIYSRQEDFKEYLVRKF